MKSVDFLKGLDALDDLFGGPRWRGRPRDEPEPSASRSTSAPSSAAAGPVPSRARWEHDDGKGAWGSNLYLGRWIVGKTAHGTTRDDATPWAASCYLPGIKRDLGRYATEDEARTRVEVAVKVWMRGAFADEKGGAS